MVRTRFAPSPTGFLHVGGVRTALFAWLVARQSGGQFILRIEDTDKVREVEGSEAHIMESLSWLGLLWDEGPDKDGSYGPYRQSERLDIYKQWAQKLVEAGKAYADPYSPQELDNLRAQAKQQKKPFLFREHRPENPPAWDGSCPLRFKSDPKAYEWHDEVMGDLSAGPEAVDDYIIIKSDGFPTYNFAHIIDDHLMGVTHVIRSQEFLPSVPKFRNLYEALEIERPALATVPYVMGPDGNKKLSKRDGAKDILDYRKEGYLPEALLNFMATLGWNDGTEQEIFSIDELIKKFSLDRVQRSGARFDERRLTWMNGHYIRELPVEELSKRSEGFWPEQAKSSPEDYRLGVLQLVSERLKFFAELPELTNFFFTEPDEGRVRELYNYPPDKLLQKTDRQSFAPLLQAAISELEQSDFSREDITARLNGLLASQNSKPGIFFPLIRIALTGSQVSPELFGTLSIIGKERSMARLRKGLDILNA